MQGLGCGLTAGDRAAATLSMVSPAYPDSVSSAAAARRIASSSAKPRRRVCPVCSTPALSVPLELEPEEVLALFADYYREH
ncbi:hypothetical protein [Nocardia sp. CA-135398]|uniref:hypothetical protein n=1 Tax=Nocardia sp. CA-135398 TaxID=3239977 RepID=UPI003D96460F